jgi:hypothetical protein
MLGSIHSEASVQRDCASSDSSSCALYDPHASLHDDGTRYGLATIPRCANHLSSVGRHCRWGARYFFAPVSPNRFTSLMGCDLHCRKVTILRLVNRAYDCMVPHSCHSKLECSQCITCEIATSTSRDTVIRCMLSTPLDDRCPKRSQSRKTVY